MTATTADLIHNYLTALGHPTPPGPVMDALGASGCEPETVRVTLRRMAADGRLVGFRLFGGMQTYYLPARTPGAGGCNHPVTYRTESGHQCVVCGRHVTVRGGKP